MKVTDVIKEINLTNGDFKTADNKSYVYNISGSDEFANLFNVFDSDDRFEEDLDSQDINLFTNKIVFIDKDGETECELSANFEKDVYKLTLTEI